MSARYWTTPDGRPGCPDCDDEPQTTVGLHQMAAHTARELASLGALPVESALRSIASVLAAYCQHPNATDDGRHWHCPDCRLDARIYPKEPA